IAQALAAFKHSNQEACRGGFTFLHAESGDFRRPGSSLPISAERRRHWQSSRKRKETNCPQYFLSGFAALRKRLELGIALLWQHHADMDIEISMAAGLQRQAPPLEAQHLVRTRPCRHCNRQLTRRRLDGNLFAEHRIRERYGKVGMEVTPLDAIA